MKAPAWALATSFPGTGGRDGDSDSGATVGGRASGNEVGRESVPRSGSPAGGGDSVAAADTVGIEATEASGGSVPSVST